MADPIRPDEHETERVVRSVIAAAMGARAARHARVKRVETAHIVQLWERGGSHRYTAVVDGPDALAATVDESREPFGAPRESGYRDETLARLPAVLRARVEKVIASWGPLADVDVSHAVEPIALVQARGREVVVTLGPRRLLCEASPSAVAPAWVMFVPLALVVQFRVILALGPSQLLGSDELWLTLLAASTLLVLAGAVAARYRLRATGRGHVSAD